MQFICYPKPPGVEVSGLENMEDIFCPNLLCKGLWVEKKRDGRKGGEEERGREERSQSTNGAGLKL